MIELQEKAERPERALIVEVDTGEYDMEAALAEMYELTRSGPRRIRPPMSAPG